ncbi:MAG: RdgB/HAM1 family non-canonical purine NTP pyrophosphatase [Moheibacter sp.]
MELIFASHNENKVNEIRAVLPKDIHLLSLNDIGFHQEIEENGNTLEENSRIKAETIYKIYGKNVFADDTGLFVESLEGAPGVYSARYAGTGNSADNIEKLFKELKTKSNRKAYFKTVICLFWKNEIHFLSGEIHGEIIDEIRGSEGFGYDPVFVPESYGLTFAEMDLNEKNQISHRARAVQKLINFVENN